MTCPATSSQICAISANAPTRVWNAGDEVNRFVPIDRDIESRCPKSKTFQPHVDRLVDLEAEMVDNVLVRHRVDLGTKIVVADEEAIEEIAGTPLTEVTGCCHRYDPIGCDGVENARRRSVTLCGRARRRATDASVRVALWQPLRHARYRSKASSATK